MPSMQACINFMAPRKSRKTNFRFRPCSSPDHPWSFESAVSISEASKHLGFTCPMPLSYLEKTLQVMFIHNRLAQGHIIQLARAQPLFELIHSARQVVEWINYK